MENKILLSEHNKNSIFLKLMTPCIYCIRNMINNKCYIGQSINLWERVQDHIYKSKSDTKHLYSSIHKYGLNNFEVFILQKDIEKEKLDDIETKYIQEYKSYIRRHGYNLLDSAKSNKNFKHSKKAIEKIKNKWKEPEYRENISNKVKEQWKNKEWREDILEKRKIARGTKEFKEKNLQQMRDLKKKYNRSRKVCQLDIDTLETIKIFNSITEAAKILNLQKVTICGCCNGKYFHCGGYKWKHLDGETPNKQGKILNRRKVNQINKLTGETIKTFTSLSSAAKENNITVKIMTNLCRSNTRTFKNYIFNYEG